MKIIIALALGLLPAVAHGAGSYEKQALSTATATIDRWQAGTYYLAPTSITIASPKITLAGPTGLVTASSFSGSGYYIFDIPQSGVTGLPDFLTALAVMASTGTAQARADALAAAVMASTGTAAAFSAVNSTGAALTTHAALGGVSAHGGVLPLAGGSLTGTLNSDSAVNMAGSTAQTLTHQNTGSTVQGTGLVQWRDQSYLISNETVYGSGYGSIGTWPAANTHHFYGSRTGSNFVWSTGSGQAQDLRLGPEGVTLAKQFTISGSSLTVGGVAGATSFSGLGTGLTGIPQSGVTGLPDWMLKVDLSTTTGGDLIGTLGVSTAATAGIVSTLGVSTAALAANGSALSGVVDTMGVSTNTLATNASTLTGVVNALGVSTAAIASDGAGMNSVIEALGVSSATHADLSGTSAHGGVTGTATYLTTAATETVNASMTGNGSNGSPLGVDPSSGTLMGNAFNGASQLLKVGADGKLPIIDGSNLTGVEGATTGVSSTCASGYFWDESIITTGLVKGGKCTVIGGSIGGSGTQGSMPYFSAVTTIADSPIFVDSANSLTVRGASVTATAFAGAGTGLTGTAPGLTAGAATGGAVLASTQTFTGGNTFATNAVTVSTSINVTGNLSVGGGINAVGNSTFTSVSIASLTITTSFGLPSRQVFTSGSGNYTTPAGVRQIRIRMVGGGGGGAASATNVGSAGAETTFNSIEAHAGSGGTALYASGAGATGGLGGTGGAGTASVRISGGGGGVGAFSGNLCYYGGMGGSTVFGGGAPAKCGAGLAGATNSGGGGGGGGGQGVGGSGGGGGGEYVEIIITSPAATYAYAVGAGGAGGAAGTAAGGAGGSGIIIVNEFY